MIDQVLVLLRDELNRALREQSPNLSPNAEDPPAPQQSDGSVAFVDGEKTEPLAFRIDTVTLLLLNIEQERILRKPDLYQRRTPTPQRDESSDTPKLEIQRVRPELRIDLSILFVARYRQYVMTLRMLSAVIQFFQRHPVFRAEDYRALPAGVEKLVIEPITLPFAAQNEVWSALRATYQPSILYRVKTLVFQDEVSPPVPLVKDEKPTVHARILRREEPTRDNGGA